MNFFLLVERNSKIKGNLEKYMELLNGKIDYSKNPFEKSWKINGYFKLKKNPRGENLEKENIILKGTQIKNTDW
jgi:hypothetical protein